MNSPQAPPHSVLREAHLRDYWKIVWQGRWTALAVFAVVLGATALWTFTQTPLYQATAVIEIQPQAKSLMAGQDVSGLGAAGYGWFAEEKYHNTQIEIIRSRDVAARVVRTLDLGSHPMFGKHPDPVDLFRKLVHVVPRRDTGLLEISISGQNRDQITQWVNEVARAYVKRNFDKAKENVQQSVTMIQQQLDGLNQALEDAEQARIETLQATQIFDAESQESVLHEKLKAYNSQLVDANLEIQQLSGALIDIREIFDAGGDVMSLPEFSQDETLLQLHRDLVKVEEDLEKAKVDLRSGHPEFVKAKEALATAERRIRGRIRLIYTGLERGLAQAEAHRQLLEEMIGEAEQFSLKLAKDTSRYELKKSEADTKRQIYDVITKTMNEVALSAELLSNNVSILDQATPPLFPVKPRKRVNLLLGAMLGMFFGLATVFFLDYLDNTIRTPEDVEKFLGVSVLGVIPKLTEGQQGLSQRATREAFQSLRTSVIFSSKNRRNKLVLTTSTGPREGKSSTVANLGRTLAAAGDRVIILDCDLRKPKQHLHHGLQHEPGLTNYLAAPTDDKNWERYLQNADPGNLHLLACGPIPPSPPELLSNERFAELLATLRERYDWVLIDSPPAASLADASLLASLADMIVMVVRHNSTDRDHVVKTFQQIRAVNESVAGVVLNNVDMDRTYHKDYYYAGYYYQEEDGGKTRRRGVERKAQVG